MGSGRYLAAHVLMPQFIRSRGVANVLAAVERDDRDFFIPVWFEAGFRFNTLLIYTQQADLSIGVIGMPQPREMTEAYLVAVVGKPADPTFCRYFLWEHSISVLDDAPRTVLGEWDDTRHRNHGDGPPFTGDLANDCAKFVLAVIAACQRGA